MSVTAWSIAHIIGMILCLSALFALKRKGGIPLHVCVPFYVVAALHIPGFLWHSFGDHSLLNRFSGALLVLDIFSMICSAGAVIFVYLSIDSLSHKVLKPDAAGDISELDMNAVENAENCYVFQCGKLYILFPQYRKIKFVFQKCPSMKDENLTYFATATHFQRLSLAYFLSSALFGRVNPRFHQVSVVGHHAQDGVVYEGSRWKNFEHASAFTFYDGQAHFVPQNSDDAVKAIKLAAENGGDGFESPMAIWDGKRFGKIRIGKKRCFRFLTEWNGRICIMESSSPEAYDDFLQSVLDIGVQKALYLDMGGKSTYSQYRDNRGRAINLFSRYGIYFSGWIAFYK